MERVWERRMCWLVYFYYCIFTVKKLLLTRLRKLKMIEIRLTIKQFEKKVPKDKKKIGGQENSEMFIK